MSGLLSKEQRSAFHRDGFIILENFAPADTLARLNADLNSLPDDARQMVQGDTFTQRILLDEVALTHTPALRDVVTSKRFLDPIYYCGAKWHRPIVYLQRIVNGGQDTKQNDPQKTMHSDSFHPSIKAWLFLEDVPLEKGPFTYVRGSNQLTRKRLAWEYRQSILGPDKMNTYAARGSLRAFPDDLAAMGLPAPESLAVKAGTLVIANTNGFHGRGQAEGYQTRLEIWAYGRYNPFNPFPGIASGLLHRLENSIVQAFYRHKDKVAARTGKRPSWYRIPKEDMLGKTVTPSLKQDQGHTRQKMSP
ncbi:hypothetical protein GCM10017044_11430 [Kordiimonas sediminis]|uniref:Phytanoyl-CoA dioxygenase n=1 Tax=Kordiimonas sediminis TaxID=1735581 RepID=A0A919ARL2_9PROT|nr:hypothetical protein GCM10017044_11430 [Kordiimonas sediminis]